ncbi:MAG: DUF1311 domain-containing protein [Gammaproteobacteria bacterium]|nr:DUF1311 domain-containing protein [Gammaproteobacteria bacterium]
MPVLAQQERAISITSSNMLQECRALSTLPDAVNNCMDNFLDLLDNSLADIEDFIVAELATSAGDTTAEQQAFERSQAAFREFRRENCLWYLEFSEGRLEAEQIAKNCLAEMSQARLVELQSLVSDEPDAPAAKGFYVYGAERNTFQFCGDARRYWVEGTAIAIGELQQAYLTHALTDLAVLYVELQGAIDEQAGTLYPGHDGVFRVSRLLEMRQPTDADCRLPTQSSIVAARVPPPLPASAGDSLEDAPVEPDEPDESGVALEPEQELTAYFGAWFARCQQLGDSYGCVLSVELEGDAIPDAGPPVLRLTRRSEQRTIVDLEFPGQEIETIQQIRWSVDEFDVGMIAQSRMRVDDSAARQQIRQRKLIQEDLLPMLIGGNTLVIEVENGSTVEKYIATLIGLTRALSFADGFTASDGRF